MCVRAVTLVYKISWADLVTRVGVNLRNNIRIRVLWRIFFGNRPFKVITCDQKPFWFNANGCLGGNTYAYLLRCFFWADRRDRSRPIDGALGGRALPRFCYVCLSL